ncbi:class II D-tagatose-bisphosphate aldolase, non-catalytic subunit [Tropicimonas isoalkanivorans]|uniref:Tagatose-bisphosphate aldolase noncatalytic subunit n=1 Tax=Tropicimonas isoalkanivorans TaxID=441112 RepID=A0A1I1DR10_9RHOB|nr:class II D-tagatose-bisphosphate aldolase, non-catalytic subunit [Tropicimonas isoalkanivorans]SFB77415.1 tagatose-bisphosphate aldolase noncatalytic subunit [Tropicimonas isoalkanivorans]
MTSLELYRDILEGNRAGKGGAVASICSAHPLVLRALFRSALSRDSVALVESTSNQVDQYGGYTGMTPADFAKLVFDIADDEGFPRDRVLLGGDHLGPNTWRAEGSGPAMEKTLKLVEAYVQAGYRKIHLDASFVCADDTAPLTDEIVSERAAQMCKVAEASCGDVPPVYIIGTEVPTPGGVVKDEEMHVTSPEDVKKTLAAFEAAFKRHGLEAAWERVTGLVVQPGVEFGDGLVEDYAGAPDLSKTILDYPGMVFEAHSTDYQTPENLSRLVADHFGILKVGPWLTYALREALMALELVERESMPEEPSEFRAALTRTMKDDPKHWKSYYTGTADEIAFKLIYSYSDRARYYLPQPAIRAAVETLFANLSGGVPEGLLSQFLPAQYRAYRAGKISAEPRDLAIARISDVIDFYLDA